MMVQSAPLGEPTFICTMAEHNDLCGQFARAFGNDGFERLDPFDEMVFVLRHERERGEEVYSHVPRSATEDTTVTVKPRGNGVYSLAPFPFAGDRLQVACRGRCVQPFPDAQGMTPERVGAALRSLPTTAQQYLFVAG